MMVCSLFPFCKTLHSLTNVIVSYSDIRGNICQSKGIMELVKEENHVGLPYVALETSAKILRLTVSLQQINQKITAFDQRDLKIHRTHGLWKHRIQKILTTSETILRIYSRLVTLSPSNRYHPPTPRSY